MNRNRKLPELDMERIAKDEARGITFSDDKRTLISCNKELDKGIYAVPHGVTVPPAMHSASVLR